MGNEKEWWQEMWNIEDSLGVSSSDGRMVFGLSDYKTKDYTT
jgi:predicted phage-related endonuclease